MISSENHIPLIGISGNFNTDSGQHMLAKAYVNALLKAGACPVILPAFAGTQHDSALIDKMLSSLDGIVFSGGGDFTPALIGEEEIEALGSINPLRDACEFPLMRRALALQLPVLGICRGEQLLNLVKGGSIYQDLPSQYVYGQAAGLAAQGLLPHDQSLPQAGSLPREQSSHTVVLAQDSLLASLFENCDLPLARNDEGQIILNVNSFHHQAIKQLGQGLRAVAWSADGVVEAVESCEYQPLLAVQWHPECLVDTQTENQVLFQWLCREALLYRRTRLALHQAVSIDLHCDAPMFFEGHYNLAHGGYIERGKIDFDAQGDEKMERVDNRVDLDKLQDGGIDAVVMAAYIKQLSRDDAGLQAATDKARRLLAEVIQRAGAYPDECEIVRDEAGLRACKARKHRALLLGIENGYALGKDANLVDEFAHQGVVYITLCHNGHNDICDSASQAAQPEHHGISHFGREVIARMNRAGIIIDLSHASELSFYDAIKYSKTPIICSHSSAWALCPHRRNLKDEQIKALAKSGGMMGICLYDGFLAQDRPASIRDVVAHIDYVRRLVGIDYVGIGSDFDGGGGISGCQHSGELFNLVRELLRKGYSQDDLNKLLGGNFLRVLNKVQQYAASQQAS